MSATSQACGRMRRLALAVLLAAALAAPALHAALAAPLPKATPESAGMSQARLAKIGTAMREAIARQDFQGVVVMVARRGRLVYSEALGALKPDAPMRDDAIFRLYSMTKPLVSVAAMLLVEDGTIQLTDPVSKYLPGFDAMDVIAEDKGAMGAAKSKTVPAERPMTVQDLLRHTSGLAYAEIAKNPELKEAYRLAGVYRPDVPFDARQAAPRDEVAGMAKTPLVFQPGTTWNYGMSTDMLGRVIEAASGQRLGEFMQARLLGPVGMTDTGFFVPAAQLGRLAEPLPKDRTSGQPNTLIDVSAIPQNDSGGAGGVSTASDYLRFCQMLLNGGAIDGTRVLSRTTVRLMTSDHLGPYIARPAEPGELLLGVKGYTFGLGFAVRQEDGLAAVPGTEGEFTWGGYAGTYFWVDPEEELTAVMMSQAPGPLRAHYRRMLRQMVYQAIVD